MPTFKPKNIKKILISKKNITTLDGKHKEIIDSFTEDKEKLPKLINQKKEILLKLKNPNIVIDTRLDLCDELKEIKHLLDFLIQNKRYLNEYLCVYYG